MKYLVPVDGSEEALRAVEHVIVLRDAGLPVSVHLLNVQPSLSSDISRFVSRDDVVAFHQEQGEAHLVAPAARLAQVGVATTTDVAVGSTAQVICDEVKTHDCDGIVMGCRGLGGVVGMLLGSTAQRVMHLATVPATLVP